jgi:hypothetical protein
MSRTIAILILTALALSACASADGEGSDARPDRPQRTATPATGAY